MGLPNIQRTGISGMMSSKAAVATTGHNIANVNTEGFSRQRVQTETNTPHPYGNSQIGTGSLISRVERINDEYIEKQIRHAGRDLAGFEEKEMILRQTEDIFNEMNGDGLNRLVATFFNEFRKLSNEPENEALRASVREASRSMCNDFHRLRKEVEEVQAHIDSRLEGYCREVNSLTEELKDLNMRIRQIEISGASPNDLLDKRDLVLKKLASYMNISAHKDGFGSVVVDIRGIGPLVSGPEVETLSVTRSPADDQGKPDNAYDLKASSTVAPSITHQIKGGKFGALLEVRDQTLSTILDRLDEMAFTLSTAVNEIHRQGFTPDGVQNVDYFKTLEGKERAAGMVDLSDAVKDNVNNIATAVEANAPGDNRLALAIAGLQDRHFMNEGKATMDDWYNSIVSDVGVATAKNREGINQQKDIMTQLNKMRDQISGVSIDEETANLIQFQHMYDASAKVIQVADEMLKTVLELKRD